MSSRNNTAWLLLGSNIDAAQNLSAAVRELARFGQVAAVSQAWKSDPVGDPDQPSFLNAAVRLATELSIEALRNDAIAEIEGGLNRQRDAGNPNAARTIDIDIVLFNRDVREYGTRCVPDPDVLARAFVAVPLAEIDPDYVHPQTGETLARIAARFDHAEWGLQPRPDVVLI